MLRTGAFLGGGIVFVIALELVEIVVLQTAMAEKFSAIDAICGAVLVMQMYLTKTVSDIRSKVSGLVSSMEHVPTKDEMKDEIDNRIEKQVARCQQE